VWRQATRAALLGAGIFTTEAGKTPGQPPLLPASRSASDTSYPRTLYEQGFTINGARNKLGNAAGRIHETDEVVEAPVDLHYIRDELRSILNLLTLKPGRVTCPGCFTSGFSIIITSDCPQLTMADSIWFLPLLNHFAASVFQLQLCS
jgi:hypothetical protein